MKEIKLIKSPINMFETYAKIYQVFPSKFDSGTE
jgi:hypothetical protein